MRQAAESQASIWQETEKKMRRDLERLLTQEEQRRRDVEMDRDKAHNQRRAAEVDMTVARQQLLAEVQLRREAEQKLSKVLMGRLWVSSLVWSAHAVRFGHYGCCSIQPCVPAIKIRDWGGFAVEVITLGNTHEPATAAILRRKIGHQTVVLFPFFFGVAVPRAKKPRAVHAVVRAEVHRRTAARMMLRKPWQEGHSSISQSNGCAWPL